MMSSIQVRPFRRSDRDQLTQLMNAHIQAVVPGMGLSVSAALASLERQPGEFIEDPWVSERVTLVAEQQDRVSAAAHLLRYYADERAGQAARGAGAIGWFLFWPEAPAGNPALARPAEPPVAGLSVRRSVGTNGCRLSAVLGQGVIGYIEVESFDGGERLSRHSGWADVGNLHVDERYRRRGVATWLLGQAAGWLQLAGASRLLDYAWLEGTDPGGQDYAGYRAFLPAAGFLELSRTRRGWTRIPQQA
jgi:ribosomal protein S18 acetylase RimI-like enzyme